MYWKKCHIYRKGDNFSWKKILYIDKKSNILQGVSNILKKTTILKNNPIYSKENAIYSVKMQYIHSLKIVSWSAFVLL